MTTQTDSLRHAYGKPVRITSSAGPCLTHYVLDRVNRTTVTVSYARQPDQQRRYALCRAHVEPCNLCPGGASYPHGYMD